MQRAWLDVLHSYGTAVAVLLCGLAVVWFIQ
jgi:hypothetical protein